MKTFDIDMGYKDCTFKIESYVNGNLAISIIDDSGFPLCMITKNLDPVKSGYAYLDINNCEFAEKLVQDLDIATFTGETERSGFIIYPLYRFNMDKLKEYQNIKKG